MEQNKRLELSAETNDILTYALQQNGLELVRMIIIKNESEDDIESLTVRINTDIGLAEPFEQAVEALRAGEEMSLRGLKIIIKGDYLASLTERVSCVLHIGIYQGEDELASVSKDIVALAYDEWPGLKYFPDLLAAFVTPNHPVVAGFLQSASKWLDKWTGRPSLEGYQSRNQNRVKMMAAAVYAAIQEKNIAYAVPPSSFELVGQRVRLCEAVMEQHLGTCMDMTLLYVACLEAMGLNPVMILMRGHIFAGVWLVEESFADPIVDDPSQLEKRMAGGIHEMIVMECTAMCSGKSHDFDSAIQMAVHSVKNYPDFVFAIDVLRARRSGVRPLPVRVKTDSGYVVEHTDRKESDVTSAPESLGDTFEYDNTRSAAPVTKQTQWERKLLDMSLRNMLINMRLTKAVVPLLSESVSDLEDALSDGEEFQILPRPLEWDLSNVNTFSAETTNELGPYADLITLESRHHRLHSIYPEKELNSCLTKMYRSAKTSMEENGASTLYLALGLLRWFEGKKSSTPRYAPIIMIPIDIIRKSASKGYVLRMRDEDAQINITLLEFLKQNFDIVINGLNPIPMDEHGVDMNKIFAIIRHGVMDETLWDVIESGFIGNFSFSQFVMWNDIHGKTDFLERNKVVRSLMKGAVDWDCTIPEHVDTDEAYLPITADSSQLRAINMAAGGVSFVLHGPPGTGKSQTITAMIANALTKGKTVLFVAEKMAALEVVQKRLAALGIGDFCFELHSNKATKKSALDQLKRGLEIRVWGFQTDYNKKIEYIRKMRRNLDAYAHVLHEHRPFGNSLRELIDIYEFIPDHGTDVYFDSAYVAGLTQSNLDNHRHSLERLIAAGQNIGHPHEHPLLAVQQTVYTQSLKMDMEKAVSAYKEALVNCQDDVFAFSQQLELAPPVRWGDLAQMDTYARSVLFAENIPSFLMETDSLDQIFRLPGVYIQRRNALKEKTLLFTGRWNENFLRMDMESFRKRFEEANKKFFSKGKALAALTSELQAYAAFQIVTEQIPVLLTDISFYQQEVKEVSEIEQALPPEWKAIVEKYNTNTALQEYQAEVKRQISIVSQFSEQIKQLRNGGRLNDCFQTAKKTITDFKALLEKELVAKELLLLAFGDAEENWLEDRIRLCNNLLENAAFIKDWIVYRQFQGECRKAGLSPVCEAYENGLSHEEVLDVYLRSIYKAIALSVIEQEPVLNGFTGIGFNESILQFKRLDREFMELTKDEMFYQLTHQLPTGYESVEISKELNILRRAISSNGRGMSIRTLFEQIPHVLAKLCPCMLMSPISVAQYLSADSTLFDIVIFDEASQLPTCKAAGVMARGENVVIVGDPNQMPPTSFFAGSTVDEDNLDIEDLDSILDDCLALGMPQTHLQWHYRSRHESLIAFSNHEFYENNMLTFPSVNDREKRVSMVKVDGFFDRGKGRVNEAEARAIVREIKRRYEDPVLKHQTIGVVTFNLSQQTLIEDILQEEFQKNAAFDSWASQGEESLFVKNLENVQGDERDVILFSVSFGPDAGGKLSLNFGPLNKEGGWKRLNVAVSRARSEMLVFTTMTADMIDLKRTKSKGVESLKNFLEFAEKGRLQMGYTGGRSQKKQGIMDRICRKLTENGYQYQISVGHSDFKVDIAVVNPYNKDEYLLGIMLDGDSYRQSANTKDREVAQISVLEGLGWELHRIWSMDWWDNREKELSRLMTILDEKKESAFTTAEVAEVIPMDAGGILEAEGTLEAEGVGDTFTEDISIENSSEDIALVGKSGEKEDKDISEVNVVFEESSERGISDTVVLNVESKFAQMGLANENEGQKIAAGTKEAASESNQKIAVKTQTEAASAIPSSAEYECAPYESAVVPVTPITTAEYITKASMKRIEEKLTIILEKEATISYERLIKKTLRGFDIGRASNQTTEATEKVLKKMPYKANRQNGVKFYWKESQSPDMYHLYRIDINVDDKRALDDICQQELKNAVCITLQEKGALSKDELTRETIRTMGYGRSGAALMEAVERGLKYGRKTGEILLTSEKKFILCDDNSSVQSMDK